MGEPLRVPAAVRRIANELSNRRGVLGVFWGAGMKGNKWTSSPCIVVHVREKVSRASLGDECFPMTRKGRRIDVLPVGRPRQQWLDTSDLVVGEDEERGRSTITAMGKRNGRAYAVLCGHGTLPAQNGTLPATYDPTVHDASVQAMDTEGARYDGKLLAGRLDALSDFTFAWMQIAEDDANHFHHAAGRYPPLPVRTTPLRTAERVQLYSSMRRRMMIGRVLHIAAGYTFLPGYGGNDYPYLDLVVVESIDAVVPFSVRGDSGSLVVDNSRRVIGTIVAGNPARNLSYVLPIGGAVAALGANAKMFFQ